MYLQHLCISYSQKINVKRGFPNLTNGRISQFMFPKYLIEYQNLKKVKSKVKSEKSNQKPKYIFFP